MKYITVIVLVAVALTGTGCSNWEDSRITCEEIIDPQIAATPISNLSQTTVGNWIRKNYTGAMLTDVGNGPGFYWTFRERDYGAYFDGTIQTIGYYLKPEPAIADVTRCFGDPDFYRIDSNIGGPEAGGNEFSMWYLKRGYIFRYAGFGLQARDLFDEHSTLNRVDIVRPGSPFDMARPVYASSSISNVVTGLKSWPIPFQSIPVEGK